jgi:hypothetical protein
MAPGYTVEEKKWLRDNWGGEYRFLSSYGLKIQDEEDREEGRAITRAFIEADKQQQSSASTAGQSSMVRNKLEIEQSVD